MAASLDGPFALHERALTLRAHRAEVIGHNIANADTPGYKARDFDFAEVMRGDKTSSTALMRTHPVHIGSGTDLGVELGYRIPLQPSLDQNTVETHVEQAEFTDNAIRYQAALQFLNGKINRLRTAITGQ